MENRGDLENKVVIITGASKGIGFHCAKVFSRLNSIVVLTSKNIDNLKYAYERLKKFYDKIIYYRMDVSDYKDVKKTVEEIYKKFNRIDVLVNNAGIIHPVKPLWKTKVEDWEQNLKVNLYGFYYTMHEVLPIMIEQKSGSIINVSSGASEHPVYSWSAYCSAKAGVNLLTLVTALEVKDYNIRVNALYPGIVDTNMQEQIRHISPDDFGYENVKKFWMYYKEGWLRDPEEPALVICWLAGSWSKNVSGQILNIDDPGVWSKVRRQLPNELFDYS